MDKLVFTKGLLLVSGLLMAGCQAENPAPAQPAPSEIKTQVAQIEGIRASTSVTAPAGSAAAFIRGSDLWLLASENRGLWRSDLKGSQPEISLSGEFEHLALAETAKGFVGATLDLRDNLVRLFSADVQGKVTALASLPRQTFEVNWLCMQPSQSDGNLYLWVGSEDGLAHQWYIQALSGEAFHPQAYRSLSVPQGTLQCAVQGDELYLSEPEAGVWAFDVHSAADNHASLVLSAIDNQYTGLAVTDSGQLLTVTESGQLALDGEPLLQLLDSNGLPPQEVKSAAIEGASLVIFDDGGKRYHKYNSKRLKSQTIARATNPIPEVPAWVESDVSDRPGDTMDDPAIWIHPTEPANSRILGTNKRWGLLSFDMQGNQLQALPSGRVNNVDLRQQLPLGGKLRDIAVASKRDNDSLAIYEIDADGQLTEYPNLATELSDIYGLCMYRQEDTGYVFANDKSGRIDQLKLGWEDGQPTVTKVRTIKLPSQVEGCAANDITGDFYVGEEDVGIWHLNLKDNNDTAELILPVNDQLVADVEGVDLYSTSSNGDALLVVSSQGNNSYAVYNADPPYEHHGRFRIGVNALAGVDGSAETDGLAVTNMPVGSGAWSQGMMVVQDGRNRLPSDNQNYKWVPWSEVAKQLN